MSDRAVLLASWASLARRAGAGGDVAALGEDLVAAWGDPRRAYHDLRHLADVLHHVDDLADEATDPDAVRLAAWFHDSIYEGTPADEERSAAWAATALHRLDVRKSLVAEVVRLVLLTAIHSVTEGDRNGAVLCDADLAVLAAEPERYAEYAAGVRGEFADVDDASFRAGRAAVLEALLARPRFYSTRAGSRWEQRARTNVTAELARLRAGADAGPRR